MRYQFGDCILDTEQLSLKRLGQPVRLQPRVFQMLAYLLEHRQRVVPRQELFEQMWRGHYVSHSALENCIKQVRQSIGDSGRKQHLIKTQHGVGYRFVAPVSAQDAATAEAEIADHSTPELAAAAPTVPLASAPERRQLTVLSCSLADAPYLVSQLDPDDLHAVLQSFHALCADTTAPYGGRVAQCLDDHCLIYFGYPQAHDDDARRAVLAALKLIEAMRGGLPELGAWMEGTGGLKVGIHTGEVVVDAVDGTPNTLVVGAATMQSSALSEVAAPQTVVISSQTARLVEGYITRQALAPVTLPGQRDVTAIYRVTGGSGAQIRLDLVPAQRLTPFVGRETELALLDARWAQARAGRGQAVIVSGEAGIGKSRLTRRLAEQLVSDGCTAVEGRGSPYYQQSAFYPLTEVLCRILHLDASPGSDPASQCEAVLQQYGIDAQRRLPFVAPLVNLTLPPERYETSQLTPQQRRQRTLESLTALVLALTERQPLLLILEDLHWMDPSTLEWLEMLLDQIPTVALLLLMTCRPEFEVPWHVRSNLTQVTLDRLEAQHSRRMVESLIRDRKLPVSAIHQIVEHSDGVPLFVEELARAVVDTGLKTQIPTTLQDTLTARLDQVGAAKRTAQLGAVMGRQFEDALIRAVSPLGEDDLQQDLRHLVDSELLYRRGIGTDAVYRFKHALILDAAYASLLRRTRQQIHRQIAQVLETQFPETTETHPELLARHFTEAEQADQAIPYWQKAGERAIERSANTEAIIHLQKGLDILNTLPDAAEHDQQELKLQRTLGVPLLLTKGFAASEVGAVYNRARELCYQIGDTPHIFPVLFGLWGFYHLKDELQTAHELAEEILALAQHNQEPALVVGHRALGDTLYWLGEFVGARAHLEKGIALYDVNQHQTLAFLYGQDPLIGCRILLAQTLRVLGYPDRALQLCEEAIAGAQKLEHPFSLAFALLLTCAIHGQRREWQAVLKRSETLMAFCTEQGFTQLKAQAMRTLGRARVIQGDKVAIAQVRQGMTDHMKTGARRKARNSAQLAEMYLIIGEAEAAMRIVIEALATVEETGERCYEAELHRLKGASLLALSGASDIEAEACFQQALSVARSQQAKSWELRAATSLARLWQSQGKRQEAYELLSPVYGWFTEGFGTADLKEAKALLNELAE